MRTAVRLILLYCISTAYAQTPGRQQPRFALEIAEDGVPSRFVIVPEEPRGGGIDARFFGPFHLLPGREAENSEQSQPSAVRVVSKVDGDEVAFTVSVIFGPFDQNDTNQSLESHPQRSIGSYSAHLNELITLQGMEQFGLRAWTIKIVNAQLSGPASLPMVNEVPSIQPEILGKDREGYRIALHNLSSQPVTTFLVETTLDHNSEYSEGGGGRDPLIATGGSHEFRLFCDTSASASSSDSVPGAAPCAFILKAALFADGSYEGDAGAAVSLAAPSIAAQFQRRRVHDLIDSILADASLDDASRLSRIRSELPKLSGEPPPEILEQIRIRFPGLTSTASDRVNASIKITFESEERNTLRALKDLEELPNQSPFKRSLAQWWETYEK